jgi:uncharacterized protein with FMN-binding domain
MRRIVTALAGTVTALVMLFGYHTSTAGSGSPTAVPTGPVTTGSSSAGSSSSTGTQTYTGDTVQTQWGPVQVQIAVSGGQVTEVTTLQHPSGNPRDEEINAYALPVLRESALSAQSADIDLVSGATVTSQGYVGSLQSALDQAHL